MSFLAAYDIWKKYTGVNDGFYVSLQVNIDTFIWQGSET